MVIAPSVSSHRSAFNHRSIIIRSFSKFANQQNQKKSLFNQDNSQVLKEGMGESEPLSWLSQSILGGVLLSMIAGNLYYYSEFYTQPPDVLSPDTFKEFKIKEKIRVNEDTCLFRIQARVLPLIHGSGLSAPSHILIKDDSCQIARAYTPITFDKEHVDLLVKLYPSGSISPMLHGLEPGDKVHMSGPLKTMEYRPNVVQDLSMVGIPENHLNFIKILFSQSINLKECRLQRERELHPCINSSNKS
jgi:hypothetical protein